MITKVVLCVFLSLLLRSTRATYTPGVVNELTSSNFTTEVLEDETPWLVLFYAPQCYFCNDMLPELQKLAEDPYARFKVGKADAETHKDLYKYVVENVPTIQIFAHNKSSPTEFEGERLAENMKWAIYTEMYKSN